MLEGHYIFLKTLHVVLVTTSIGLFIGRAVRSFAGGPPPGKLMKVLPHVQDTALLASGVALTLVLRQYPFVAPWLTAKVIALVVYVVAGALALKSERALAGRWTALAIALLSVSYIVLTALHHDPDIRDW